MAFIVASLDVCDVCVGLFKPNNSPILFSPCPGLRQESGDISPYPVEAWEARSVFASLAGRRTKRLLAQKA